jgi:hypothetical protein
MSTTLTSKCQVTIPKKVREAPPRDSVQAARSTSTWTSRDGSSSASGVESALRGRRLPIVSIEPVDARR